MDRMQPLDTDEAANVEKNILYERFAETLLAYLCQQVTERQDAEDLLLEVFLAALQNAALTRLPSWRQRAWLRRVRERLGNATSLSAATSTPTPAAAHSEAGTFAPHLPHGQARRSRRFVTNLVAALLLLALILGSLALFRAYPFSNKTPVAVQATVSETAPFAQAQAHGPQATMRVLIGGPYFLGELLPIDVSFTNHTQQTAMLDGSVPIRNNRTANMCYPSELLVQITQGSKPTYTVSQISLGCTQPYIVTKLQPGQTITIHQYVPLTKSGAVTLARGIFLPAREGEPLDRQWPTVHVQVQVSSHTPRNRSISLQQQKRHVIINAPAQARAHMLYMQDITCVGYDLAVPGEWTPLLLKALHEPLCPTAHRRWTYIVSAPGYAVVFGSQT
jgi:hypothetical protein